jgi:hypothetical protein
MQIERLDETKSSASPPDESAISAFFRHPAVLLVLGFMSTGLIGGRLSEQWKQHDWINQQNYLLQRSALDKKYALVEETAKAIAERNTSAEDILASYTWNWSRKEISDRRDRWQAESPKWRIASAAISQKLATYYKDPGVSRKFDEVIRKQKLLGNKVVNLLTGYYATQEDADKAKGESLKLIDDIKADLQDCGVLMAAEISKPFEPPAAPWWKRLWYALAGS